MYFAIIYVCSSLVPSVLIRAWPASCEIFSSFPFSPSRLQGIWRSRRTLPAIHQVLCHLRQRGKHPGTWLWDLTASTTCFAEAQDIPRFYIRLQLLTFSVPVICGIGVHIWNWPCQKMKGHCLSVEAGPGLGSETGPIMFAEPWLWPCSAPVLETRSVENISVFLTKERSIHILLVTPKSTRSEREQAPWPQLCHWGRLWVGKKAHQAHSPLTICTATGCQEARSEDEWGGLLWTIYGRACSHSW